MRYLVAMSEQIDVVCLGEALIDCFAEGDGAVSIVGARAFLPMLGGAPLNVAVGLARQGIRAALLAIVGRDGFGDRLRLGLQQEGVETRWLGLTDARTGLAFVARDAEGERSFLFYRERTADQQLDVPYVERHAALIAGARVLHFCGNGLAREPAAGALRRAVELAREAGVALSFDLNLRFHLWDSPGAAGAAALALLPYCHLVKADQAEAEAITGETDPTRAARALLALGPSVVAVTRGAAGAVFCCAEGQGTVAAPDARVVDSTGAGDAFAATLLAGLLRHGLHPSREELTQQVELACAAGASVCEHLGALAGLPRVASGLRPASLPTQEC